MPNTLYAADRSTGVPEPPVPVAALTARLILADCVRLPDVPTTVTLAYPSVALLVADRTSRVEPVVLPGLNDALTSLGKPDTENVTLPLNHGRPHGGRRFDAGACRALRRLAGDDAGPGGRKRTQPSSGIASRVRPSASSSAIRNESEARALKEQGSRTSSTRSSPTLRPPSPVTPGERCKSVATGASPSPGGRISPGNVGP